MQFDYEVVIVGTGFGATVAATELAAKFPNAGGKPQILMLERGVWWFTPERPFPDDFKPLVDTSYPPGVKGKHGVQYWPRPDHRRGVLELLNSTWANIPGGDRRDFGNAPQPLYRFNTFDELDVVTASGVGGGSLIYSNVSIEPHRDGATYPIMEDWAKPLTPADYDGMTGAKAWMKVNRGAPRKIVTRFPPNGDQSFQSPDPTHDYALLGKCRWLKQAAAAMKADPAWKNAIGDWEGLDLAVIEYPDPEQEKEGGKTLCERQGRCFLGCLPGARHTLNKTLIGKVMFPKTKDGSGAVVVLPPTAEVRSLAEVVDIEKLAGGGYKIHYDDLRFGDHEPGRKEAVTAKRVVLAAGCLATNEIMLNLKNRGWALSDMVGAQFSTNGDYAGFIDYPRKPGDKLNFNPAPFPIFGTRGPINASHVKFSFKPDKMYVNFEDATIPPMLAPFVRRALDVVQRSLDHDPFLDLLGGMWNLQFEDLNEKPDPRRPDQYMTEHELLQNTFFFNLMGRDEARGRFSLNSKNKLTLGFDGGPLSNDPVYTKMEEIVTAMAKAMNGEYMRFPFWGRGRLLDNDFTPDRKFITVHPLGGCAMGHNSADGVVNTLGQVFDNNSGNSSVHQGFYIMDASVIPGPLAVNPTLTIVAMAKRIAAGVV